MIQCQDSPWQHACPLPIPDKPLADAAGTSATDAGVAQASSAQPEPRYVAVLPEDDYHWMFLL